ncbi:MAG: hypothetical protein QOG45_2371, partial [Chloroflexota bacterium]|nr:hypothetical protein [Chloroflexota bacterium]
ADAWGAFDALVESEAQRAVVMLVIELERRIGPLVRAVMQLRGDPRPCRAECRQSGTRPLPRPFSRGERARPGPHRHAQVGGRASASGELPWPLAAPHQDTVVRPPEAGLGVVAGLLAGLGGDGGVRRRRGRRHAHHSPVGGRHRRHRCSVGRLPPDLPPHRRSSRLPPHPALARSDGAIELCDAPTARGQPAGWPRRAPSPAPAARP